MVSSLLALSILGQAAVTPETRTVTVDGVTRQYLLYVPASRRGPLPIVFGFHGFTSNMTQFAKNTGLGQEATRRGMIAVIPQALGKTPGWNVGWINLSGIQPGPDEGHFFMAMLDQLKREFRIDRKRIYVMGHSNGGFLSHLLGSRYGDVIAAIAPVAGTIGIPGADNGRIPEPKNRVNVLVIHGDADNVVAFDRNASVLLKGYGAEESAKWWAERTQAKSAGKNEWRTRTSVIRFAPIKAWDHRWPTAASGYDATAEALKFFLANPKR